MEIETEAQTVTNTEQQTKRRVLITGMCGQDGYYLAKMLSDGGDEVFGCDVRVGGMFIPLSHQVNMDILHVDDVNALLEEIRPDEIYHLAACTNPMIGEEAPALMMEANGLGTLFLLMAAQTHVPNAKILVASSDSIFGVASRPQNENTPINPDSIYGISKALATMVARYYRLRGMHVSNAILFNHTSPRQSPEFLPMKVAREVCRICAGRARCGDPAPMELWSLHNYRDWSHAADVVSAMVLILRKGKPGDYVIGSGTMRQVFDLVQTAFKVAWPKFTGEEWSNDYLQGAIKAGHGGDHYMPEADMEKLRALGWTPSYTFEQMVAELIDQVAPEFK